MSVPAGVMATELADWEMWDDGGVPTSGYEQLPIAPVTATIDFDLYFKTLAEKWKKDTRHLSLISLRVTHPAYKRIITLGRPALPLILAELRDEPDHWFHALSLLSDENPVPQSFRGTVTEAAELWVKWGHNNNLLSDAA